MIRLEKKFQPHSQVVATELDPKEAVLLHMDTTRYFTVNETGWRIWKFLEEGLSLKEITEKLQDDYEVEATKAEQSVIDLITDLQSEKLVEEVE